MLVLVIEILEMLVLVIKFRICIYEITIHHLKNVTLLLRHIVFCCQRCPARILAVDTSATTSCFREPMSGTGLHRASTGRCYLQGRDAWWGTRPRVPSSTLISFGGVRVGHFRCGGSRPRRRWCVAVSGRRTSMPVATWLLGTLGSPIPGRFFGEITRAMIQWWFLHFGCPPPRLLSSIRSLLAS